MRRNRQRIRKIPLKSTISEGFWSEWGDSNARSLEPKSSAIPTSLHPDIHFPAMIPRRGVKIKFFLSVVIYVVKAAFVPLSAIGENPENAGAARLCGVSTCPVPDSATALPKQARYQLRYTRLFRYFIRLVVFSQIKRDTNFAIPGYFFSIPQLRVEGKRKFLVYINKVVIGGRLPADDDLIQICIKRLACCALRQREGDIRAEKVGVDGQVEAAAL